MKMAERDTIENAQNDLWALATLVGNLWKVDDGMGLDLTCPYLESRIEDVASSLRKLMLSTTVDKPSN